MKRLYLSNTDKKLAGVCGGLGEYFEIDSTLVRLFTVVITVATGFLPMLIAYIVGWMIIPRRSAS
jgi:phage shock protein C